MGLREEKKAEQRRAIIETAVSLFRERGYEQARVQDIIKRSRISEATFFNYFPKKEALLYEIAIDQIEESIAALKAELERHDCSVPDRLRSLVRQWAKGWESDRDFNALVVTRSGMLAGAPGLLREKELALYDLYRRLFAEGQKRKEIRADVAPLDLAEMLEGMLTIIAGNWLVGWWKDRKDPLEDRMMRAVEFFLEGCKPSPVPRREARTARKKITSAKRPVRAG